MGYRLFQANHDRYLFKKDFVVELRVRYAHSLGGRCDLEYNLYDAGLLFFIINAISAFRTSQSVIAM